MFKIKKILLPLDLEESPLPVGIIRQAAGIARHFQAEILVLHVVRPLTYMVGSEAAQQRLNEAVAEEETEWKKRVAPDLEGVAVRRKILHGDPARQILSTAHDEQFDLIVMPTHSYGAYDRFLLGSVTTKVIHRSECPVWAGAHMEETPCRPFAIRKVLCAIDLSEHSRKTILTAHDVADAFGAQLTLAHATPGVEIYGPGGHHVLADMKRELINATSDHMAKLQQELGTTAATFVGSGDVAKVMCEAVKETDADLLVVGTRYRGDHLGGSAYGIIRESRVPVLAI